MSLDIFLLSMQAAGAITSMIGTDRQIAMGRIGRDVEQSQLETRLEQERLAAAYGAVDAMKVLRQTLASQRAISAARGVTSAAGTAFTFGASSISDFTVDERIRRMNLLAKEASIRSHSSLASLHQSASESRLGQQLSQNLFNQIPFSEIRKEVGERNRTTTTGTTIS